MESGDQRSVSTQEWGELVKLVLTNKLVSYLFDLDEEALSRPSVVAILEEELRPFLTLKAEAQSQQPREAVLGLAHERLLEMMQRLFLVAQQAVLNRARADEEDKYSDAGSGGRRLLTWHIARMNDIGEQFMSTLAGVAERHRDIYDQLSLPAGILAGTLAESAAGGEESEEEGRMARRHRFPRGNATQDS